MYRSCIMDECGCIIWWCSEHTEEENRECLQEHPERRCACVQVGYYK